MPKDGRPTDYNEDIATAILSDLTHQSTKAACEANGITERTYYNWLKKYPEFFQLSVEARKVKGVFYHEKAAQTIEEATSDLYNKEIRPELAKLRFDGYMRLAGKANQGLFEAKEDSNKDTVINVINRTKEFEIETTC
jgi:hypothetical protein